MSEPLYAIEREIKDERQKLGESFTDAEVVCVADTVRTDLC
ncbi:MAG: hypothetical protein U0798_21420 [Gemmataceae bacterium]